MVYTPTISTAVGEDGAKRRDRSVKDVSIQAWFEALKQTIDQMPDENVFQVPLPFKKSLYHLYLLDCETYPTIYKKCQPDYFFKVWNKTNPHVKLRKHLRFSKCFTCTENRNIKWDRKSSPEAKAKAMATLVLHFKEVKQERAYALAKKAMAIERPHEVLSFAIDGTDQLPKGLPQFRVATAEDNRATSRMMVKFTLGRIHGLDTTCYEHAENIAGDPNLTVEVLQRMLKKSEQLLGKLPPELHIQLDNCFRENKNSYVVNWLGTLAERGLFPKGIYVSFLPVGHTHNEMDQVASRISIALRRKTICTRGEMYELLKKTVSNLSVERLVLVANTKKWLNPEGNPEWTGTKFYRIHGVSDHRFFRIRQTQTDHLELRTRKKCTDEEWSLHHLMRRQAKAKTGFDLQDISGHPGTALKELSAELREKITTCLGKCKRRVPETQWDEIQADS